MTITTKAETNSSLLTIPLHEKVFVTEMYQDRSQNLVAIGLRSSVVILELLFDEQVSRSEQGNFDKLDYQVIQKINHDSRVQCIAWSPETSMTVSPKCLKFATGGADYNVRLFSSDLADNEAVRVLRGGHSDYINSLAYQPSDGSQIVSGSDDHTIALWDSDSGQRLHTVTFRSAVMAVSWHPEEVSKLMVAEKSGILHLFNIVSYHPILSLDCGNGPLLSADWSLYNSLLIATSIRSDVIIWDLSKMAPITKKYLRQDNIKSVKMSPSSESVMATAGQPNYSVNISNIKNSHITPVMTNQPIGGISWHPSKSILVVGHDENISIHHITKKIDTKNKMEEFEMHKIKSKISDFRLQIQEEEFQRNKKRNDEVDQLIRNLGDPRVAEKLRIYRLVEEQFALVESQVQKEVQEDLLKRRKEKSDQLNAKTSQSESSSYRIEDTKKLLTKVSKLKSHQKEERLKSSERYKPPTEVSRLQRTTSAKYSAGQNHGTIKKNIKTNANIHHVKPSSKINTKTYKKSKPSKDNKKESSVNDISLNNSDFDEDDALYPIGEPIIKNLAGNTAYTNIGYSSVVFKEPETTLSGHILGGVNIDPSESKICRKIASVDQTTNVQMIEINAPMPAHISECKEESSQASYVEKFSWDKLSDSIKLFSSSQKDEVKGKIEEKSMQKNIQIPEASTGRKGVSPKTILSDTSLNEEYSMEFDDENEAEAESETQKSETKSTNKHVNDVEVKDSENKAEIVNYDILENDSRTQFENQTPISSEQDLQENNIVNQIYCKLHLSQDSVCSTISDRLSTIPEDPRSHEEREQKINTDTLSMISATAKNSKHKDENESNDINIVTNDSEHDMLVDASSKDDMCITSPQGKKNRAYSSNSIIKNNPSPMSNENDGSNSKSSDKESNASVISTKDKTDRVETVIYDDTSKTDGEKSAITENDSSKTSSKIVHNLSNPGQTDCEQDNPKQSSLSNCLSSNTSVTTSYSPHQSTDTSSTSKNESCQFSKYTSKNEQTTSQFSELSNISEGQVINIPMLSEGELSITLKSNEEIINSNHSKEYLADDSENGSDQNKLFVPKKSKLFKNNISTSDICVSNKKRHELKERLNDNNSSSSGDSSNFSRRKEKSLGPSTIKHVEDHITLSEGELSESSGQ